MKAFSVVRYEDPSGISGIGLVAEGVVFSTGRVVIQWLTTVRSVAIYDSLEDAIKIHGHEGKTKFLDEGEWQQ